MSFVLKDKALVDTLVALGEEFEAKYVTAQTANVALPTSEDLMPTRQLAKKLVKNLQIANIKGSPAPAGSPAAGTSTPGTPGANSNAAPSSGVAAKSPDSPGAPGTSAAAGTPAAGTPAAGTSVTSAPMTPEMKSLINTVNSHLEQIPIEAEPNLHAIETFLFGAAILLQRPDAFTTWINQEGIQNANSNIITGGTLGKKLEDVRRLYADVARRFQVIKFGIDDFSDPESFRGTLANNSGRAPTWADALGAIDQLRTLFNQTVDAYRQLSNSHENVAHQVSTFSNLKDRMGRLRQEIKSELDRDPRG
jgi:hypothetical protein